MPAQNKKFSYQVRWVSFLLCGFILFQLGFMPTNSQMMLSDQVYENVDMDEFYDRCNQGQDAKIVSNASLSDDFAEKELMVVMKKEYSQVNKAYTAADFPEINAVEILDLTARSTVNGISSAAENENFRQILLIKIQEEGKQKVLDAVSALEGNPKVLSAEPSYVEKNALDSSAVTPIVPNDPLYPSQYALKKIQADLAWNYTTGADSVKVGVIDTGFNISLLTNKNKFEGHNEFADNVNWNLLKTGGSNLNDPDLSESRSFTGTSTSGNIQDDYGHGSAVGSIIGASSNNGQGLTGVCWNVDLIALKINDKTAVDMEEDIGQNISFSAVVQAINYAEDHEIPILNLSMSFTSAVSAIYSAMVQYSGLLVCSAGNHGSNTLVYPAGHDLDNIISVAASDRNDNLASFSGYHSTAVDLTAPGASIVSAYAIPQLESAENYTSYYDCNGTSFAVPFVSGAAALLLSYNPYLTTAQLKQVILDNVDVISSLNGKVATSGRLNIYKALQAVEPGRVKNYLVQQEINNYPNLTAFSTQFQYNDSVYYNFVDWLPGSAISNADYRYYSVSDMYSSQISAICANTTIQSYGSLFRCKFNTPLTNSDLETALLSTNLINSGRQTVQLKEYLMGDLNNDGVVNMSDYTQAVTYANNFISGNSAPAADVDFSGYVTATDAQMILDYINGDIGSFW